MIRLVKLSERNTLCSWMMILQATCCSTHIKSFSKTAIAWYIQSSWWENIFLFCKTYNFCVFLRKRKWHRYSFNTVLYKSSNWGKLSYINFNRQKVRYDFCIGDIASSLYFFVALYCRGLFFCGLYLIFQGFLFSYLVWNYNGCK